MRAPRSCWLRNLWNGNVTRPKRLEARRFHLCRIPCRTVRRSPLGRPWA